MRIATFTALLLVTGAPAMAQEAAGSRESDNSSETAVSLLAGADYVTGNIDDREYETYAASAGLAVRSGRFSLTASVPYVSTTAPDDLIVGNGGVLGLPLLARPSTERREVTRDGIGDVVVQANARNTLLYASDTKQPESQATPDLMEPRKSRALILLALAVMVLQAKKHQAMVTQAIPAFLNVIGKASAAAK